MSNAIAEALEKRQKLMEEIALLDQYISLHERLFGKNVSGTSNFDAPMGAEMPTSRDGIKRRNNPKAIIRAVEKILIDEGRPVQRGELVSRIESSGMTIHSVDKGKYIGTVLWRVRDQFENIEGKGYWLTGRPIQRELTMEELLGVKDKSI